MKEEMDPYALYQDDPLYLAIMADDEQKVQQLKKQGVTLTDHIKYALTHPVGRITVNNEYMLTWYNHVEAVRNLEVKKFTSVMRNLYEAVGEPMHYTDSIYWKVCDKIYEPDIFSCVLECFNNKNINKKELMQRAIDADNSELLSIAEKHGWLKMPRKRDEMISYASDKNKTECLAWLLDFKNRTADLAKEQEKAEKKLMRELNASPDSVSELKKLWSWQKQEDGTLIITSCKRAAGERTEVELPAKMGTGIVSAIGAYAFSSYASRVWGRETGRFRDTITRITLPDSIKTIAEYAFYSCKSLERINIPEDIKILEKNLFAYCYNLKEIRLPDSVEIICDGAFAGCQNLSEINIPPNVCQIGSYVFSNCKSITKISIPGSVKEIGTNLFMACTSLEEINLSEGIEKIGRSAFENCKMLKTVVIPEGVEEIERCAFAGCDSLETVYLPKSLKRIKNLSVKNEKPNTIFHGCRNVRAVVYEGSYAYKYCRRNNIPYAIRTEEE